MVTTNRPDGEEKGGDGKVEMVLTEKVAIVAGVKKYSCDEFTSEEWVQLIKVFLVSAKPRLKHFNLFRKAKDGELNSFRLESNISCVGEGPIKCYWATECFQFRMGFCSKEFMMFEASKIIEICEVSLPGKLGQSSKFLMSNNGIFFKVNCSRIAADNPMIYEITLVDDDFRLKCMIDSYPQIGPLTLYALKTMIRDTRRDRLKIDKELADIEEVYENACSKIKMFDGHYVQKYPYGFSGGSCNQVDFIRQ